ncbi:MAG: MFS transporter [Firmicutes bacterium]|nr:MFS transporter [Bacillota bacterium]
MNKNAWKTWFVLMVFTVGTSMISPLLPLYQEKFNLSNGEIVLVFVIYTFAVVPSMLLLGNLADQVGRKKVIWPAMLLLTAASFLFAWPSGTFTLYLCRVLQGLAVGAFLGTCTAYVVDLAEPSQKAMAAVQAGVSLRLGFGIGPGVAGLIAQYMGNPLSLPFQLHVLLMLLGMGALVSMPETIDGNGFSGLRVKIGVPEEHRKAFFLFIAPSAFMLTVLDGTVLSLAPLFIVDVLSCRNFAVIGLVSFLVLAAGSWSQLLAANLHPKRSIISGVLLGAASLFLFLLSANVHRASIIVAAAVLIGASAGLIMKGGVTLCGLMVPPEDRSKLLSAYYVSCYLGLLVPLATGYISDSTGLFNALALLSTCLSVLAAALVLGASRILKEVAEVEREMAG